MLLGPGSLIAQDSILVIGAQEQERWLKHVDKVLAVPLLVEEVSYVADVIFSEQEFNYLVAIAPGSIIGAPELKKALFYLLRKNKFETITITITQGLVGARIHFAFDACWTFNKLKIHGFFIGRERYSHYYLMESGDPFDQKKHCHSLENIRDELKKEGFFAASILENLDYDPDAKTVTVHLTLDRGKQFNVGRVNLAVVAYDSPESGIDAIQDKIEKSFCHALIGSSYSKERLNKTAVAIKRYLVQQGFLQATIELTQCTRQEDKKIDLNFRIELHQKKEFVFFGNHHFSDAQLLDQLMLFGRSALLLPSSVLIQELTKAYNDNGFMQVHIETEDEGDRLFFIIQEGVRAQIKSIELKGVHFFDQYELLKRCGASTCEGYFFEISAMKDLLKAIIDRYTQEGFGAIAIVDHQLTPYQTVPWYTLTITLVEGKRSYISSVRCELPEQMSRELSLYDSSVPEVFTSHTLRIHKDKLLARYPHLQFTAYVTHQEDGVAIVWKGVPEGSRVFGKTVITGSSKIRFEYLMRELRYNEGDPWDPLQVQRSMVALKELDIFDQINLYPYQSWVPFDESPMLLKVIPDDPFEMRMRTGIGFEYAGKELTYKGVTYKLGGAMVFKNPFNRADYFFANADFTRTHRNLQMGYWSPWLFGYPLQTLVQAYNNAFQYPGIIGKQRNLYKVTQIGGLLGLVNKWRSIEGGLNIGFECMETTISNRAPQEGEFNRLVARAINFEPALLDKMVPYFLVEPTVFIDSLDNQLYPTCGTLTLLSLKGMIPVGNIDDTFFIKMMAEQSVFVPLRPTVLGLRLRFGHIFYQRFNAIMPSERFYLGGANSIRSYQTDLCPPLGVIQTGPECKKNFVPQGGKSMLNANIELRFPLYKQFWGVIFQDIGFLHGGNNLADLIKADLLAGTGFGIRFNTPIGPLRFDIGFKWKRPDPAIPAFAWFLTLGQPF